MSEPTPSEAENNAWFAYRTICQKEKREADQDSFRSGFRQGARFTFGSTSKLSPALDAFIGWMQYVSDWAPPPVHEDVAA
jgi:hypothetical protein